MKLWLKLTSITLACTLAALSICLWFFAAWQNDRILETAQNQAHNSFRLFCSNLESLNSAAPQNGLSDLTGRSMVQYYFATYAHLLGNGAYFSLVQEGEYLYNTCPIDPKSLIEADQTSNETASTIHFDSDYYLIAQSMRILSQEYTVYFVMDIASAYTQMRDTIAVSLIMMLVSAVIVVGMTVPLVRHALKPLGKLRQTAESIAQGEYHLRAQVESKDEVASLAASFNGMAEAVENRIDALTEESERRRLLLGALTHELKTPMTAIIGFADSMLKMPLSEAQRNHSLQQILSASQRTERLTHKLMLLLSMDGEDRIEKNPFSLADFAEDLSRLYPSNVLITADGTMLGDRDLLFSLTQNLINNALNASASAVKVILTPSKICVSDNGRGIPAEHIARLTEPFYRVDKARSRRHGGAGLGLALCRTIIEAHGGRLMIESILGEGTAITAVLGE